MRKYFIPLFLSLLLLLIFLSYLNAIRIADDIMDPIKPHFFYSGCRPTVLFNFDEQPKLKAKGIGWVVIYDPDVWANSLHIYITFAGKVDYTNPPNLRARMKELEKTKLNKANLNN